MDRDHGIVISTRDTRLALVDQSTTVPLVVTLPSDLSAHVAVFHDSGSRLVNQRSGVRLDLNSTIPLPQGCLFTITVPPSLARDMTTNLRYVYIQGFFGSLRSVPFLFASDREIEIRDACSTHSIVGDAVGSIKLKYLQNPDIVRVEDSFGLKISDQEGNILAESVGSMRMTEFEAGRFGLITIASLNETINESPDLLVQFKQIVAADRNPTLSIEVPESLIMQSDCSVIGLTAAINKDAICSVDGRKIMVTGLFNESSADELHSFRISNAVRNPAYKVDSIGTFVMKLFLDGQLSV